MRRRDLLLAAPGLALLGRASRPALAADFGAVAAAARGQTVYLNAWAGAQETNDYIAWAGAERLALGLTDGLDAPARARWPLDPAAEAVRGAGVKA